MDPIKALVGKFTADLFRAVAEREKQSLAAVRAGIMAGLVAGGAKVPTRPSRRKGPAQLCPVPGCKERAAPVFGMVCAKHKKVPKVQIKKYREARRNRKNAARKAA